MTPQLFKRIRQELGLTQAELAKKVRTTLTTIGRYECGDRRIPHLLEVALASFTTSRHLPMAGIVRAGKPVEPLVNHEATVKKYYKGKTHVELHPANGTMEPILVRATEAVSRPPGVSAGSHASLSRRSGYWNSGRSLRPRVGIGTTWPPLS